MNSSNHLTQAEHNAKLTSELSAEATDYVDWNITATFYEAVHYVDAYSATVDHSGTPPYASHKNREVWIQRNLPRSFMTDYRTLKNRSRDARYTTPFSTLQSQQERQNAIEIRQSELKRLKDELRKRGLTIPMTPSSPALVKAAEVIRS